MDGDRLTVITTAGRSLLATKRIRIIDGEWSIEEYGNAKWWSARQVPVHDLVSLGQALAELARDPHNGWAKSDTP
jgi:hypothetical protein